MENEGCVNFDTPSKWSRGDKVLLPALSGVVKTNVLTVLRYKLIMKVPNFWGIICIFDEIFLFLQSNYFV